MPDLPSRRTLAYLAAMTSAGCGGLLWAVNKQATATLAPGLVTWAEAGVATLLLLAWNLTRHRGNLWPKGTPTGWLLTFGGIAVVIFYSRTLGVSLTNPTTGSLVASSEVVLIFLYSLLVLKQHPAPWGRLGAVAIVVGVLAALDLPHREVLLHPLGVAALFMAALGTATNAVIIKLCFHHVRSELSVLVNVSTQFVVLGAILGLTGRLTGLTALSARPREAALLLAGGLLIAGMLNFYYVAMKQLPLWTVRLLALLIPVTALLADHFWLKSAISAGQLLGLVLVTSGAALVILSSRESGACPPETLAEEASAL
jgi:drug/metabolite transporter (DMT)-like permease